ncbi:MAG: accessory gene regulator B family protein [Lachnospiraceae bacterium]|nr:accessory gene regulator B family protein [Lachnospiraceae bacterium]
MFEVLSERITGWLLTNEAISREDKEIYRYGIQQGMIALLNLGTTMVIGMVFGKLLESLLFMAAYIPLRSFAGGYHAKTAVRCYFFSIVMISAVLWVMRYVMCSSLVCVCLTAVSGSMIWFLVPVEDRNKPLDDVEKVVYRKRARGIVLTESIISLLTMFFSWERLGMCMTLVLCVLALMLLLGKWKNVYLRKRMCKKVEETVDKKVLFDRRKMI